MLPNNGKLTDIGNELLHLGIGSHADQQLKLAVGRVEPESTNQYRQENGTHRIDPPTDLGTEHGGQQTEAVDKQVITVVLPKNANLRDLIT